MPRLAALMLWCLALPLLFGGIGVAVAHEKHQSQRQGDIPAPTQPFSKWLAEMRAEAKSKGISEATLAAAIDGIEPLPRVIELDRDQPEFTLTFQQYLQRVAPDSRVARGQRRLEENRELLEAVSEQYGVPPEQIVALWGIETDFGRVSGGFKVVPALATLAHDGRRSTYFRGELLQALRIIDGGHITADDMMGSWAGAMGQCQFMPSSFVNAAVDRDGDGRKDIWTTPADVFASAANLLKRNGWRRGEPWGLHVKLPAVFDLGDEGLETRRRLSIWQDLGIRRPDGADLPDEDLVASLIMPDGPDGPVFLVYDNYRAIMRWNRSHYFALTAGYLADRIAGKNLVIYGE